MMTDRTGKTDITNNYKFKVKKSIIPFYSIDMEVLGILGSSIEHDQASEIIYKADPDIVDDKVPKFEGTQWEKRNLKYKPKQPQNNVMKKPQ